MWIHLSIINETERTQKMYNWSLSLNPSLTGLKVESESGRDYRGGSGQLIHEDDASWCTEANVDVKDELRAGPLEHRSGDHQFWTDFVKNLTDVIDGYLKSCCDRAEMFSPIQIQTIFGNIEAPYRFAAQLLAELENVSTGTHFPPVKSAPALAITNRHSVFIVTL